MKKIGIIIITFFLFFVLYFLQTNFFDWFTIAGVKPNIFIIFLLAIGLFLGKINGAILGIILGLVIDLNIAERIGITSIMLGLIGYLGGILEKNFSKDSRITLILMVVGVTFFYELGYYILRIFLLQANIEIIAFLKIILIEIIYNIFLSIIFYPIIQILGNKAEQIWKRKKVFNQYY